MRTTATLMLLAALSTSAFAQIAFRDVSGTAGFGAPSAAESWGAAWGDIDNDHYPDIFANNHRTRAKLYRNNRNGTFSDVSAKVDLSHTAGWTGGRADVDKHGDSWADVDNDGDLDLWITVSLGADRLLINDGGLLTDRTGAWGVDKLGNLGTRQNLFLDYNGDGRLDIAQIGLYGSAFAPQTLNNTFGAGPGFEVPSACPSDAQWAHLADIYSSAGLEFLCAPRNGTYPKVNAFSGGVIVDVTASIPQFSPVNDAVSLDHDRDRRADLFLVRRAERPSDAFKSGTNRFEAQLITMANIGKSVSFKSTGILTLTASLRAGDNPQGDPANIDIGSINWSPTSLTVQLDPADSRNWGIGTGSPGINVGYINSTGEWKITQLTDEYDYSYVQVSSTTAVTNLVFIGGDSPDDKGYPGLLLKNTINGLEDVSTAAGFTSVLPCQSAVAGDFDNDMDEDLYLACTAGSHNIPNRLFRNDGTGRFTAVASAGGAAGVVGAAVAKKAGTSDSVIMADYDLDGFLDLFVVNGLNMRPVYIGGPKQLFHNVSKSAGNNNTWIELDLVGTTSNRDGVGSKVYVTSGGVTQYREQNGGYHRWSQNFQRVHVGLGANTTADVTVEWPNGASTLYSGLQSNHIYQVKQDGTVATIR